MSKLSLGGPTSSPASATVKCGWVEKYSVGRGFFPVRNWKKRWLMVTHQGLNYAKDQGSPAAGRTYVPFVSKTLGSAAAGGSGIQSSNNQPSTNITVIMAQEKERMTKGGVCMNPVFLFPVVTAIIHPEATDPNFFYFGLRFVETDTPRILLLRASTKEDREEWVRFIGQFVHAASLNGVPNMHPAIMKAPKVRDPEELDARSQNEVRKNVMGWDDGFQYRAFGSEEPCENMHEDPLNWDSDNETNGVSSPRESSEGGALTAGGGGSGAHAPLDRRASDGRLGRRSSHAASSLGAPPSPFPEPTTDVRLGAVAPATPSPAKAENFEWDECL